MPSHPANGLTLETERFGDPRDPAVVLVMGLGMQLCGWPDALCHGLASQGFHVLRFDNRDAGLSSTVADGRRVNLARETLRWLLRLPVRAPYRIEDMARDVLGLLDALGIERAHLVGASMGGMIAQNLAALAPDRCASLVSIMSSSGDRRLPLPRVRVLRRMLARPPSLREFDRAVQHFVTLFQLLSGPGYACSDEELRARLQHSLRRSFRPAGTVRQLLAIAASGDRSERLLAVRAPTTVIHGDADPLLPLAHGRDCARKIPGAQLEIIPGMGHDIPHSLVPRLQQSILAHLARSAR